MKFTKLKLTGLHSFFLPIEGAQPSDPYILKGVDGLGPPEIDLSFGETASGVSTYRGAKPQSREIVARIGLNPDHGVGQTAAELRSSLYGLLTPGPVDHITVDLYDDLVHKAYTEGHAKRLEIAPFSQTPEVQLTLSCLQPYLLSPTSLYVDAGDKAAPTILNVGTAKTGFYMEVIFTEAVSSWSITNARGEKMEFDYDFQVGDKLIFDTRLGSRGIWVKQGLITTSRIEALVSGSKWLMLHGGENAFETNVQTFNWGDVYYRPQYWGI